MTIADSAWDISARASALHRQALVWDMVWPLEPWCGNDYDKIARFGSAGVDVLSLTIAGDNHNVGEAVQRLAAARRRILAEPQRYRLVETVADITRAKAEQKMAIALHFEGTRCFERNLDMVEAFYQLGVRHTILAFNRSNSVGGGCAENADGGLTRLGTSLVREMNRVGMLVDLSHVGHRTTMDAMQATTQPVVFSHSNAAAIVPHFRNLRDDQVKACAATGGVVGVSSSSEYLGDPLSSTETIFRHIDYFAQLVGPQHVALGLDIVFDPASLSAWARTRPEEWPFVQDPNWAGFNFARPEQIPKLTEIMLEHGYGEDAVRGVLGENYLRLCSAVWRGE